MRDRTQTVGRMSRPAASHWTFVPAACRYGSPTGKRIGAWAGGYRVAVDARRPQQIARSHTDANVPAPPREHGAWLLAGALALLGVGRAGRGAAARRRARASPARRPPAPPAVPARRRRRRRRARRPRRACSPARRVSHGASRSRAAAGGGAAARRSSRARRARSSSSTRRASSTRRRRTSRRAGWKASIRSTRRAAHVRRQLAAARLDPPPGVGLLDGAGHLHGLNFAGCCGGPMQFNVTNGPVHDVAPGQRLLPLRPAPAGLRPRDGQASVDLRRLRRDHGRRAPALGRRRRIRARRRGLGRGL